jgi:8-oxo-dGTP pyrophosphatase MutT (NUDIX family)
MPNTPTSADPRFTSLGDVFNDPDDLRPPASHETEGRIHAAVSLVLRGGPELEVLLIRRAESEGDPWSGHMALPGGRRDDSDTDLQATAIRETLEETGVCLAGSGVPLGSLPPLIPSTSRLPPISIFPFVFGVEPDTPAEVASHEVAEVLWASLSLLRSPEAEGTVEIPLGDAHRPFPCIRVGDRVIWGLTYRILTNFFRRLERETPELLT